MGRKILTDEDVRLFHEAVAKAKLKSVVSHDSYLINLSSFDDVLWEKSIAAAIDELERAHRLGIQHVVAHPGAHMGAGEEAGIQRIAKAIKRIFRETKKLPTCLALETTAGQGSTIGHRFEHLSVIIAACNGDRRLSVCLDTCHIFAAGYPFGTPKEYRKTMAAFDAIVGLDRLAAIHLNDSKRPLGSRVDRHEHIAKGCIGGEAFGYFVNDRRLGNIPMILETAKETDPDTGKEWDEINLQTLRNLMKKTR